MKEYESLYRALLVGDWLALAFTAAAAVIIAVTIARVAKLVDACGYRVTALLGGIAAAVGVTPLVYVAYLIAQTVSNRLAIAIVWPQFPSSPGFPVSRAKLMLLSDGLDWWPPAYPGWIVRVVIPALVFIVVVWRAVRPARSAV